MNPVYGYSNTIAAHQQPKGRVGNDRDNEARPSNCYTANPKYNYVPFNGGREPLKRKEFDGSGSADERPAWRCECGEIREPQSDSWDCCSRCGSCNTPEYR